MNNKSGEMCSPQIAKMGVIDIASGNFSFPDSGQSFLIKNDGEVAVFLSVKLAGDTEFVTTRFEVGWNPEIVAEIQQDASIQSNLKWGY